MLCRSCSLPLWDIYIYIYIYIYMSCRTCTGSTDPTQEICPGSWRLLYGSDRQTCHTSCWYCLVAVDHTRIIPDTGISIVRTRTYQGSIFLFFLLFFFFFNHCNLRPPSFLSPSHQFNSSSRTSDPGSHISSRPSSPLWFVRLLLFYRENTSSALFLSSSTCVIASCACALLRGTIQGK